MSKKTQKLCEGIDERIHFLFIRSCLKEFTLCSYEAIWKNPPSVYITLFERIYFFCTFNSEPENQIVICVYYFHNLYSLRTSMHGRRTPNAEICSVHVTQKCIQFLSIAQQYHQNYDSVLLSAIPLFSFLFCMAVYMVQFMTTKKNKKDL